jgi:peptidyl-prolyl cis-trans isomerase SurA
MKIFSSMRAVLAVFTLGWTGSVSAAKLPLDGYAAVVNDRTITIGDVMSSIYEAEERLRIMHGGEELETKRKELFHSGLERLIDQALIIEEFGSRKEMQIPERMVDDRVNEIIYERFGDDRSALMSALADDQITLDDWRETIRERLIVMSMRRFEVGEKIVVSPMQVRNAYEERKDRYHDPEQVKLRMIFVRVGTPPEASFDLAAAARARIESGEVFADVAKEVSNDPSAATGGDWGWLETGMLREELKTVLVGLEVGKVSDVIFTPEGYYLLLVEERREAATKSFEEVRSEIEAELRERESDRLYRDWMKRLRQKYSVIYYLPETADATVTP